MSRASVIAELRRAKERDAERERMNEYEARKRAWVREHPDAPTREYARAMLAIAEELGL